MFGADKARKPSRMAKKRTVICHLPKTLGINSTSFPASFDFSAIRTAKRNRFAVLVAERNKRRWERGWYQLNFIYVIYYVKKLMLKIILISICNHTLSSAINDKLHELFLDKKISRVRRTSEIFLSRNNECKFIVNCTSSTCDYMLITLTLRGELIKIFLGTTTIFLTQKHYNNIQITSKIVVMFLLFCYTLLLISKK